MRCAFGAQAGRVARTGVARNPSRLRAPSANGALHTSLGRNPRITARRGRSANGAIHRLGRRIPAFGVEGGGGEPVDAGEDGVFLLVAGLHAGALEVGEDEVLEAREFGVALALAGEFLGGDGFVVLEGLDGEGAGDAEAFFVLVGLVVEGFFGGRFAIGDAAEGDVGHLAVGEALAQVAGLLVVEQVVGKGGAEQPGLGDIEGDARGVGGDPAPPPLLGHIGGGARTARRVQHQVAGVGGHQDAALDHVCV